MSEYEITYTSDAEQAEESRAQLDAELDAHLQSLGGAVSFASGNIPRRLFFPIKGKRAAALRTIQVELSAEKIQEVQAFLKKLSGVLRFSILQTPRRSEIPAAITELLRQKRGRDSAPPARKPLQKAAPVTMEQVEKGIEKALEEEVK